MRGCERGIIVREGTEDGQGKFEKLHKEEWGLGVEGWEIMIPRIYEVSLQKASSFCF